jgi:Domain of unknown function (DUF4189)
MLQHRFRWLSAAVLLALFATTDIAQAFGALAIDSNRGSGWGWSKGMSSRAAAQRAALAQCGRTCHIVLTFWNTCGAFAADQTPGSTINGWGTGPSTGAAQARAVAECRARGGACQARVWACD